MEKFSSIQRKALYGRFVTLIRDEELYRYVLLDRETICHRLGIERHMLNSLLNDFADGISFPAYVNRVRLEKARTLLHDEQDLSVGEVADAVGFTPQNLRLQFKKCYGITPTEFRKSHSTVRHEHPEQRDSKTTHT